MTEQGQAQAVGPGTAIVTAYKGTRTATALVTVEAKGRLTLDPTGAPAGTSTYRARLYDASNTLLAQGTGTTFDRESAGGLAVELEAHAANGDVLAVGRREGLTLHANQLTRLPMILNVPTLSTTAVSGGPGASVVLVGSRLREWVKHSGGSPVTWVPSLSASIDGVSAQAAPGAGDAVRVTAPASLAGTPAVRTLRLSVGGVDLTGSFRLLKALAIDTPTATVILASSMDAQQTQHFVASGTDTANQSVSNPNVIWSVDTGEFEDPVGTIDEAGNFLALRVGSGVVRARSGSLSATVPVMVVPAP
jgi:hypothetical protein